MEKIPSGIYSNTGYDTYTNNVQKENKLPMREVEQIPIEILQF